MNIVMETQAVAFGRSAERFARRLPHSTRAIICDGTASAEALAAAVASRRKGGPFFTAALLQDTRGSIARSVAHSIYMQYPSIDERRILFEGLANGTLTIGEQTVNTMTYYPSQTLQTMREFVHMGDAVLVRSQTERLAVEKFLQCHFAFAAVAPLPDDQIPDVYADPNAQRIVVWGPEERAESLTLYAYALADLKTPAIFVCQGKLQDSPHEFIEPFGAEQALRQAALIVDTDLCDPGTAIAFAGRGFGIIASQTSGAHEFVQGLLPYDPADFASLLAATSRARGLRRTMSIAPHVTENALQSVLAYTQPPALQDAPLVSLVIPTYNRPEMLRTLLGRIAGFTYRNLEVIVVNDAGKSMAEVVAPFDFVRYLEMPSNGGTVKAANFGLRAATGEYVGLLADDDDDYPDHFSKLVAGLVDSGLDVAHSNIALRLDTKLPDGTIATYGHLLAHAGHLDHIEVLYAMQIMLQGMLIRRSAFEKIGFLNETRSLASDYDTLLRLAATHDFVHVNTVTGEMCHRDDKTNLSSKGGFLLAVEIEELLLEHAPEHMPSIRERQAFTVRAVAASQQRDTFFSPAIRLTTLIPRET